MIEVRLNLGDLFITSRRDVVLTCLGLGSCIGLFMQDRTARISGGAHILLPERSTTNQDGRGFYDAAAAIAEMLRQFATKGSTLANIRAKFAGGANVLATSMQVGLQNQQMVTHLLQRERIFIAGTDIGGGYCRSVRFDSETGDMKVKIPLTNEIRTL